MDKFRPPSHFPPPTAIPPPPPAAPQAAGWVEAPGRHVRGPPSPSAERASGPDPPPSRRASDARSFSVPGVLGLPFQASSSRRLTTWSWRQQPLAAPLRGVFVFSVVVFLFFLFFRFVDLLALNSPTTTSRMFGFHRLEAGEAPDCGARFSPLVGVV